ncbi:uncharacterized protein LOC120273158 [Dioscorea cayenensis subsp. rotundata]|uniref:Uncharacterized protein LOC120273158 n=1 Tax=Dioscorea cayennensis subsp. rotundata TaxID=55577 RepID=A0AB40CAA7_DIOCR|nr:uncharacterized protein LOC120273158 [Dioscorea cayenensis subsp. rotundata]
MKMKNGKKIQEFISHVLDIVYQIRALGEDVPEHAVVGKISRSLTPGFKHVVSSIVEAKDLRTLTEEVEDKAHSQCISVAEDEGEEGVVSPLLDNNKDKEYNAMCVKNMDTLMNSVGTMMTKKVNVVEETKEEEESCLFMVTKNFTCETNSSWLINSGCYNHMSGNKDLFHRLEDMAHQTVRLGDGKVLNVASVGLVSLHSNSGKQNMLHNVQYVPQLAHNLLSVGQLMASVYSVVFLMKNVRSKA